MKVSKKYLITIIAIVTLIAAMLCIYLYTRPVPSAGSKHIFITVIHKDGSEKSFSYQTDAEYLDEVLQSEGLISGDESPYGLYVTTVDGEEANYDVDRGWWCLTKDGNEWTYGVSVTTIADGDKYEWTYTIG